LNVILLDVIVSGSEDDIQFIDKCIVMDSNLFSPFTCRHIPKAKATTMAETPELKRIAENTRIQSNVSTCKALSFAGKVMPSFGYELGWYRFIKCRCCEDIN
jgi:hypothetical protein